MTAAANTARLVGSGRTREGWMTNLRTAFRDYQAYRATVQELKALTDRELADIGTTRSDAPRLAREAIYGV